MKPVAWMGIRRHGETRVSIEKLANDDIPLYTHPVELTDEEILKLTCEHGLDGELMVFNDFARAILRKAQGK